MEMPWVYILYSKKLDRFYTGVTTLPIEERLENHLQKRYGKLNFTQKADDWTLFWSLECISFKQARNIELHIKKMKSKIYIQNLGKYLEIGSKLLKKYECI
jgi:putative endonuclease